MKCDAYINRRHMNVIFKMFLEEWERVIGGKREEKKETKQKSQTEKKKKKKRRRRRRGKRKRGKNEKDIHRTERGTTEREGLRVVGLFSEVLVPVILGILASRGHLSHQVLHLLLLQEHPWKWSSSNIINVVSSNSLEVLIQGHATSRIKVLSRVNDKRVL